MSLQICSLKQVRTWILPSRPNGFSHVHTHIPTGLLGSHSHCLYNILCLSSSFVSKMEDRFDFKHPNSFSGKTPVVVSTYTVTFRQLGFILDVLASSFTGWVWASPTLAVLEWCLSVMPYHKSVACHIMYKALHFRTACCRIQLWSMQYNMRKSWDSYSMPRSARKFWFG